VGAALASLDGVSAPVDESPPPTPEPPPAPDGPRAPVDPRSFLKRTDLLVDSALSPAVFVGVNLAAGLKPAAIAALALAVLIMAYRLVKRQDVTYAFGGVFGTGIAVAIALKTGDTEGFFWPKVLTNTLIFLGLAGSVLFKKPAIGFLMETVMQTPSKWWQHPRVRPALSEWTMVWALSAAFKAVVYLLLILAGRDGALLGVSVAFGYPLTAFLGFGGYVYIRARLKRLGAPEMDAFRTPAPAPA
jgi:intracellular septation protein A